MPIYEYICQDCGKHYEQIVLSPSQKVACPGCASERRTLQLSVFSAHTSSSGSSASARPNGGGAGTNQEAFGGGSCACGAGGCGWPAN